MKKDIPYEKETYQEEEMGTTDFGFFDIDSSPKIKVSYKREDVSYEFYGSLYFYCDRLSSNF